MQCVKIIKSNAESAKRALRKEGLLDNNNSVKYNNGYVYFPVSAKSAEAKLKLKEFIKSSKHAELASVRAKSIAKKGSYNDMLKSILTKSELDELARGYDLLGSIAIIELSDKLARKEKKIAKALIDSNQNIKTVLKKAGPVHGIYRTRRLKYIAGRKTFIAEYRENNCVFVFDTRKVFFSNRLSYERSRLASAVKDGEHVMVMFAGVGPFAIEIAKSHKNAKVIAIELNKHAYMYMQKNIELNKTSNVKAVLGDVRKECMHYKSFADRIIMPMPKSSMLFLDEAYYVAKKHSIVHIYTFAPAANPFDAVHDILHDYARKHNSTIKVLGQRIVRPYSASEVEIVIDFEVTSLHD